MPRSADVARARAIAREVPSTFDRCVVRAAERPAIDARAARAQHAAYVAALRALGVDVLVLPADDAHPDCVFVEDTAVVLDRCAVACAPGEPSRLGEVAAVVDALRAHRTIESLPADATLEGGDVLAVGRTLFVGRTDRTNDAGIAALSAIAAREGRRVAAVRVRDALHLKSVVTAAREDLLVGIRGAFEPEPFAGLEMLDVGEEKLGANVLPVAGAVLVSAAAPRLRERLERRGVRTIALEISEMHKADGALTCSSILL